MSKLFKYKEYLTLEEARRHLEIACEDKVSMYDIFQLALDGKLTFSIRFQSIIPISPGRVVEDVGDAESPDMIITEDLFTGKKIEKPYRLPKASGFLMSLNQRLLFSDSIQYAQEGYWELSMLGQERDHVKRLLHDAVDGDGIFAGLSGNIQAVVLKRGDLFCKLKEINLPKGVPADKAFGYLDCADDDEFVDSKSLERYPHHIVIETKALTKFVQSLQEDVVAPKLKESLSTKEHHTYLVFVRALLHELKIDPGMRGAAAAVQKYLELSGSTLSENTIRKILAQINEITD